MMASAMMADTTGGVGTVADLAPTMTMGLKVGSIHAKLNQVEKGLVLTFGNTAIYYLNRMTCGGSKQRDMRAM